MFGIHVSALEIDKCNNNLNQLSIPDIGKLDAIFEDRFESLDWYCSENHERVSAL